MVKDYIGDWRMLAFRGFVAVLFGLATLVWPGITLWSLVILFGAFALADGVVNLAAALFGGHDVYHRGWLALSGLGGIAAGIVAFAWPSITALALLYVIATWAFVTGVAQIAVSVTMRKEIKHEWMVGLAGVLSILFGAVLVITPGAGALAITWAIGWYAFLFGVTSFVLASEVHHEAKEYAAPRTSSRSRTPHPAM